MDSVKEAMRRLTAESWDVYGIDPKREDDEWFSLADKITADGVTLAAALKAKCPADSDEPITEAWLRSVGFEESGTYWLLPMPPQALRTSNWAMVVHHGVWILEIRCARKYDESQTLYSWLTVTRESATRADVRLLCRALGIELKESSL